MQKNIKTQLEVLVKLQKIETSADEVTRLMNQTPERLAALTVRLSDLDQTLDREVSNLDQLKKEYREYESETQITFTSIEKSRNKLNSAKNNKEYQSSLKEIEDFEEKNSRLEDIMIQHLDKIDETGHKIEDLRADCTNESKNIEEEKETIEQEAQKGKIKLSSLSSQREEVIKQLAPEFLNKYNNVKRLFGAIVIVPAIDSVCHGCNMNIPPQMYNELQRFDGIKFCPHCQRIIYWGGEKTQGKPVDAPVQDLAGPVSDI